MESEVYLENRYIPHRVRVSVMKKKRRGRKIIEAALIVMVITGIVKFFTERR